MRERQVAVIMRKYGFLIKDFLAILMRFVLICMIV
jgi:hypothetical protein